MAAENAKGRKKGSGGWMGVGEGGTAAVAGRHILLYFQGSPASFSAMGLSVDMYKQEMAEALRNYERYIVCIDKTPEEFQASVMSLMDKAIKAYENRGPGLRHGIALDKQLTIILSQSTGERLAVMQPVPFVRPSPNRRVTAWRCNHPV